MNTLIFFTLVAVSTASASIIGLGGTIVLGAPSAPAVALQGPSSQTALTGPDGSAVVTATQGGAVATGPIPGGVVTAAAVPGVVAAAPAVLAAPALSAPSAILTGPSGTVISNGLATTSILGVPRILIG